MKLRHRGLRRLYEKGDDRGVSRNHAARVVYILTVLEHAQSPDEVDQPGFRLHRLKGSDKWSERVSRNWRVVFRFVDGEAVDVDLLDYL